MSSKNSEGAEKPLQTSECKVENANLPVKNLSISEKLGIIFRGLTVEPIIVIYSITFSMCRIALQNLSLEKACRVNLAMDEKICDAMSFRNTSGYDESDEVLVQKLVTSMYAWKNVVECSVPSLLLLFFGSWSDRHRRRKPCILIPILGELFAIAGATLCTYFYHQLSIEYNIFFEASSNLVGGTYVSFMGVFVYISEVSSVRERTLRIGAASICWGVSSTFGTALSGVLYNLLGFYGVFALAFVFYTTCLLYGVYGVAEVPNDQDLQVSQVEGLGAMIRDFFNIKHVKKTFDAALKSGTRSRRLVVCSLMVLMMVIIGPIVGEEGVMYLFVRFKFGWDGLDFSFFRTFKGLIDMAGTVSCLIILSKLLKMDDSIVGFFSCFSKICANIIFALAPNTTVFYVATVVEMFNGTSFVMMRSIISKLVPAKDLGKVQSLLGVADCFIPIVYGPAYNLFYKATIETMPAAFFFLGAGLTFPALLIYLYLYFESKRVLKEEARNAAVQEDLLRKSEEKKIEENDL